MQRDGNSSIASAVRPNPLYLGDKPEQQEKEEVNPFAFNPEDHRRRLARLRAEVDRCEAELRTALEARRRAVEAFLLSGGVLYPPEEIKRTDELEAAMRARRYWCRRVKELMRYDEPRNGKMVREAAETVDTEKDRDR